MDSSTVAVFDKDKPILKAGGVILGKGQIYIITKYNEIQLPKGHVEEGEEPLEAAIREVKEETGFENLKLLDKKPVINKYNYYDCEGKKEYAKLYIYIFTTSSREQKKTIFMKLEKLTGKWMDLNEAIEKTNFENVRKALLEVRKRLSL